MTENQILGPDLLLQKQAAGVIGTGVSRRAVPAIPPAGRAAYATRAPGRSHGSAAAIRSSRPDAIDRALDGHRLALLLCLEWIIPPRRSRPILLDLPPIRDAADLAPAIAAIIAG